MGATDPPAYQLDAAQARRLVGILGLRPGERVLHLGHRDAAAARLAAYLVGPTGEVVEAGPGPAGSGAGVSSRLPFPDDEFDAVLTSQVAGAVPTSLLAELGRVTRHTGRVGLAMVPPPNRNPNRAAALVDRSGLRGTVIRFEPGTAPGAGPVFLVTAFPPRPASGDRAAAPGDPTAGATAEGVGPNFLQQLSAGAVVLVTDEAEEGKMNGSYGVRGLATRAVRRVWAPGGRARVVVGAAAATVLAIGAGIAWGLAGDAGEPPAGVANAGPPAGVSGDPPGAGSGLVSPLDPLGDEDSTAGGGTTGGDGLSGGLDSGPGRGDGGGPAGNRPPVIEDPGVSSDGMTLTIAPTVTDPDGDEVEVGYDDGNGFVLVAAQPTRTYPVRDSTDGYRHRVEVTIQATDAHGAVAQQTVSHQLEAISTVVVRRIELALESPQSCFANTAQERFAADLRLRGAVVLDRSPNEELRPDRPTVSLLPAPVQVEVIGERPQQDLYLANAALAGERDSLSLADIEPPVRPRRLFLDSRCQARVSVGVGITTR